MKKFYKRLFLIAYILYFLGLVLHIITKPSSISFNWEEITTNQVAHFIMLAAFCIYISPIFKLYEKSVIGYLSKKAATRPTTDLHPGLLQIERNMNLIQEMAELMAMDKTQKGYKEKFAKVEADYKDFKNSIIKI